MAKQPHQKLKLLYLMDIFEKQTDENHPMTIRQLIAALAQKGVSAERKSLYDDIEALQLFGLDIVVLRGRSNAYYLGARQFELPELKLLVDAAQSAKFITAKKSAALIQKISGLSSLHEASLLQRHVFVQGRVKTMNESIYYTVDTLQNAINQNSRITCHYYEWVIDPAAPSGFARHRRHKGATYHLSPWMLIWDNENYYLLAFDAKANILKHYRVDKMADISLTGEKRQGRALFEKLDMAEYTTRTFGMFGGDEQNVKLRFSNRLIGVVVDRFGKNIQIQRDGEHHFCLWIKAIVSPQFIAWVLGFGKEARVLEPPGVMQQVAATLEDVSHLYST